MLQMMQYMHNIIIYFEHRFTVDPKPATAHPFWLLMRSNPVQAEEPSPSQWCNFCDEPHDPMTCEPFLVAKERAKGKKSAHTVAIIEEEEQFDDVCAAMTRNQAAQN